MGLNPAFLMKFTIYKDWEKAEANYIQDCIECGSCSYTCPANRPLLDQIRLGKGKVMGIIRASHKTRAIWKTNYTCLPRPTFMVATA
jgi:electron transport complex protein RnfC